jgi:AcrR family transcriptional regulator
MSMTQPAQSPDSSPGRRERRRRELRDRVLLNAVELARDQGFDATTVEQIAAASDIAPATFFNHFGSKAGLLAEITREVADALEALVEGHLGEGESVRDQLEGLAANAARQIEDHRTVAREIMLQMLRSGSLPVDAAPYLASFQRPLESMLQRGQERGEVRADLEAAFLAEMVLGAFHATVSLWLSDESYPIAARLQLAASFLWDSVRARPGQEDMEPGPSTDRLGDRPGSEENRGS